GGGVGGRGVVGGGEGGGSREQQPRPPGGWDEPPMVVGSAGGLNCPLNVPRRGLLKRADQVVDVGGIAVLEEVTGFRGHPRAVDEVVVSGPLHGLTCFCGRGGHG